MNTVTASVSGENLEKSMCKMQIPTRRISGEKRIGTKILKGESLAWNLTLRKTRRDATVDIDFLKIRTVGDSGDLSG
jgi:hypothetical protein